MKIQKSITSKALYVGVCVSLGSWSSGVASEQAKQLQGDGGTENKSTDNRSIEALQAVLANLQNDQSQNELPIQMDLVNEKKDTIFVSNDNKKSEHNELKNQDNQTGGNINSQVDLAKSSRVIATENVDSDPSVRMIDEEERVGLDTINLPEGQGNWLYKTIYYERSQNSYEKTHKLVDQIWDLRVTFFNQRSELDRTVLDPFYIGIGLRQGELQQIISDISNRLELERTKQGELNIQERELLGDIKAEHVMLEQLSIRIKTISDLDHALDDALDKLMDQITKARGYEKEAWENFKKVSQILSDTKARELYYVMDIQMRNIKDIYKYLDTDFRAYFSNTVKRLAQEIKQVEVEISKLKEQGVDFKKQVDMLADTVIQQQKTTTEEKEGDTGKIDNDESEENGGKESTKKGFFYNMLDLLTRIGSAISLPFKVLSELLFG